MPQFLVIAYDGTDAAAPARRMAARPAHLESVKPMVVSGEMIVGDHACPVEEAVRRVEARLRTG